MPIKLKGSALNPAFSPVFAAGPHYNGIIKGENSPCNPLFTKCPRN